ncbi:MAG TPA: glycoside hydrolase family 18 [Petrimonas sp.]|uniref:glycosyl hydrolase family 18 protein n=1 Tax=Petrimonas sp. TaxID=2023866 RepID=UPI0017795CB4|nr:glycoside hydrolase family 18 [Petrimonas sp.]
MKKLLFVVFTLLLFTTCEKDDYETGVKAPDKDSNMPELVEGRVALAYVTSWSTVIPDPRYLTNINYAFAEPYMEGGAYKGIYVLGDENRFRQIVNLKKANPNLSISISFENSQGEGFSQLAKSDEYRKAFANDCKAFLQKWGIDGVDMDWEFPGLSWSGDPNAYDVAVDVANHVLLMRQLRETLGNQYLLTYAGYCMDKQPIAGGWRYIDIAAVASYVDFVNIMTYDLDAAPHHQSALYDPSAASDCTRAVQAYLDAGMPANKLVLGIPFHGRHSWTEAINYKKILELDPRSYKIDNWDNAASAPYVTYNGVYYCGYDNEKSIGMKGDWVLGKGMKGLMFWDYDGDDNQGTLRKAVWRSVMKSKK